MIRAAPDVDSARAIVDQATAALGQEDSCTFCSVRRRTCIAPRATPAPCTAG